LCISYPDLIKLPYFADITQRGDRGSKRGPKTGWREDDFKENSNAYQREEQALTCKFLFSKISHLSKFSCREVPCKYTKNISATGEGILPGELQGHVTEDECIARGVDQGPCNSQGRKRHPHETEYRLPLYFWGPIFCEISPEKKNTDRHTHRNHVIFSIDSHAKTIFTYKMFSNFPIHSKLLILHQQVKVGWLQSQVQIAKSWENWHCLVR